MIYSKKESQIKGCHKWHYMTTDEIEVQNNDIAIALFTWRISQVSFLVDRRGHQVFLGFCALSLFPITFSICEVHSVQKATQSTSIIWIAYHEVGVKVESIFACDTLRLPPTAYSLDHCSTITHETERPGKTRNPSSARLNAIKTPKLALFFLLSSSFSKFGPKIAFDTVMLIHCF